ncbi:hypothetical protein SAMN05216326_13322 [Nitrosomonas marina]|uniref:Integral membrane protein n=1 Tax=Nitrosomonas marina TaxID=917 RepID=A0A1I0F4G1_9PROT|nr:hypothetical protein [Nitrosomonas marina]SET52712.1 hypothetical protein SAMN05216326_13322 [Nitrosomonas marina]
MLDVVISEWSISIGNRFAVSFQRTLKIPDDGNTYPLPPGLGAFPVHRLEDCRARLPNEWKSKRGALIPMYQREALWLGFRGATWKPNAVKIAVGGINAISGKAYEPALRADEQDYIVVPTQPWLDGINTGETTVRQFVAMPLGQGYSIESALTGIEELGGIQITVFEPKPGLFPDQAPVETRRAPEKSAMAQVGMGLGAGGRMRQKIYTDPFGIDVWDEGNFGQIEIFIVNSLQYQVLTGCKPPPTPIDAATYTQHGLPWFDLYDEALEGVAASETLAGVKSVADVDQAMGRNTEGTASVNVEESQIRKLHPDKKV